MFSDCRKMMIDSSAKGSVSGSDSRIVIGMQPRLELRRQNQIHEDERQHEREHEVLRRAAELARAAGEAAAVVAAGLERVELGQDRVLHLGLRRRRQQVAEDGDLPLPRQAVDVGRRRARREVGDVVERRRCRAATTAPSGRRSPPRSTGSRRARAGALRTARRLRCRSSPGRRRPAGAALRRRRRSARRGRPPSADRPAPTAPACRRSATCRRRRRRESS